MSDQDGLIAAFGVIFTLFIAGVVVAHAMILFG